MTINGEEKFTNPNNPFSYFKGSIGLLSSIPIIEGTSSENEKIFYKWGYGNNNYMEKDINPFNFLYDGELSNNYKTKLKADNVWAISNVNQTKAIRDTNTVYNGMIHQVHESIGGIFYSRSTDNGASFQREEVVNYDTHRNETEGNKNPSINIKRGFYYPVTQIDPNENVAVVWERYNSQTNKTEINVAERKYNLLGTASWEQYKNNLFTEPFCSFLSSQNFSSNPKLFVSSSGPDLYHSGIVVVYLKPYSNTTQLVISVKYIGSAVEQVIDDGSTGTISNFSVSSPYCSSGIFGLHIVYQKDNSVNNIVYKYVEAGTDSFLGPKINEFSNFTVENIGAQDGMNARFSPDISLQNGLPIIAYRGNYYNQQIVSFENNEDNFQTISVFHKPIIVKYKEPNGNWSSYIMYDGLTEQENPNIEGSRNATAYLLNFKKNGSYYQFVKINGLSGYSCNPGVYPGSDAKLVKGSYIGQYGTNSNPMLLTLSNPDPDNSLYTIGKQSFTINNTPVSDGFDNLDGTIIKEGIFYSLSLGPIIASNTTFGFEDDVPPQTVHNPVEFNETMKSAVFSLSNGDTLILGSHGKYSFLDAEKFHPLKFHVSLINSETGIIHRDLFSDTITIEDTVGLEFYRGFVIDKIEKGTENFYVQLFADTTNITDADYEMSASYADAQEQAQGNGKTLKSGGIKIFFEKPKVNLNPVNSLPKNFELSQNYPNPFNPTTKINYALPKSGLVTLKIYDLLGREIITLINEYKQAGNYTVSFNAMNLASGIYLYKIQSGDFVEVKKMTLIK